MIMPTLRGCTFYIAVNEKKQRIMMPPLEAASFTQQQMVRSRESYFLHQR
jgi:hypothetical protein